MNFPPQHPHPLLPKVLNPFLKTREMGQFWLLLQNQLSGRLWGGFLMLFTQIVLQQQHATPGRALVWERNGWNPSGRPSTPEEWVGGRQRDAEDLWLVVYPVSCLISDAKRRRRIWKSSGLEAYMKMTEKYGACQYLRSFPSADTTTAAALPACFTHQTWLQAGTHIELEASTIQRIYEKYFTLVSMKLHHSPLSSVLIVRRAYC